MLLKHFFLAASVLINAPVFASSATDPGIGAGLWVPPGMPNRVVADPSSGSMNTSYIPGCLNGQVTINSGSGCASNVSFNGPLSGTKARRTVRFGGTGAANSGNQLVLRYQSTSTAGVSNRWIIVRSSDAGNVGVKMRVWLSANPAATYASVADACRQTSATTPMVITGPGYCTITPNTTYYFGIEHDETGTRRFQVDETGTDFLKPAGMAPGTSSTQSASGASGASGSGSSAPSATAEGEDDFVDFMKKYSKYSEARNASNTSNSARFVGSAKFREDMCLYNDGYCECPVGNKLVKCLTSITATIHTDPKDIGGRGYVQVRSGNMVLGQNGKWAEMKAAGMYSSIVDPLAASSSVNIPLPDRRTVESACSSGAQDIPLTLAYGAVMPMDIEMAQRMKKRSDEFGHVFDEGRFLVSRASVDGARSAKGARIGVLECNDSDNMSIWNVATIGVGAASGRGSSGVSGASGVSGGTTPGAYTAGGDTEVENCSVNAKFASQPATDPGIGKGLWVPPNTSDRVIADQSGPSTLNLSNYVPGCLNGLLPPTASASGCGGKSSYTGKLYGARTVCTFKYGYGKTLGLRFMSKPNAGASVKYFTMYSGDGGSTGGPVSIWLSQDPTATYATTPAACKSQSATQPYVITGPGYCPIEANKMYYLFTKVDASCANCTYRIQENASDFY